MTIEKMQANIQNVYRMLEKADVESFARINLNDETVSQLGALILAIADLTEILEGLVEQKRENS